MSSTSVEEVSVAAAVVVVVKVEVTALVVVSWTTGADGVVAEDASD